MWASFYLRTLLWNNIAKNEFSQWHLLKIFCWTKNKWNLWFLWTIIVKSCFFFCKLLVVSVVLALKMFWSCNWMVVWLIAYIVHIVFLGLFVCSLSEMCKEKKCDYLFSVDGSVVLTNKDTLKILIKQNRSGKTSIDFHSSHKAKDVHLKSTKHNVCKEKI